MANGNGPGSELPPPPQINFPNVKTSNLPEYGQIARIFTVKVCRYNTLHARISILIIVWLTSELITRYNLDGVEVNDLPKISRGQRFPNNLDWRFPNSDGPSGGPLHPVGRYHCDILSQQLFQGTMKWGSILLYFFVLVLLS